MVEMEILELKGDTIHGVSLMVGVTRHELVVDPHPKGMWSKGRVNNRLFNSTEHHEGRRWKKICSGVAC
jgi:hypothetical protein